MKIKASGGQSCVRGRLAGQIEDFDWGRLIMIHPAVSALVVDANYVLRNLRVGPSVAASFQELRPLMRGLATTKYTDFVEDYSQMYSAFNFLYTSYPYPDSVIVARITFILLYMEQNDT